MATRYIIGKGELLTYPIEPPGKNPGEKAHPYTLAQAKEALLPQIEAANKAFDALPAKACPGDLAVALLTLHPAYIAKSYFPRQLLHAAGLESLGSRTERVRPRRKATTGAPDEADTTQLFLAGKRSALRAFHQMAEQLPEGTREALEFARIESFAPLLAQARLRPFRHKGADVFEVGLHVPSITGAEQLRSVFAAFAQGCGFVVNPEFSFDAGRLLFVPVEGDARRLEELAQFTLMRVVRPMPRLRAARPMLRSNPVPVSFDLPAADVMSREPKVAVLDGGLPDGSVLQRYVRKYFVADESAEAVDEYLAHGLGVTSALLFGPIEPGGQALRPYAPVDHHRVLDARSDKEDPYELYRTLAHVETVLLSRSYQFINLSMGPDLCVEDHEVHAWTAVIDEILSDGQTLLSVAVGNNGKADAQANLNRIQVPGDCVNALSVGAVDRSDAGWRRADYSAIGPGRSPGRRKPDLVAFGGSGKEYFHVVAPGARRNLNATLGTSFAALRAAVGIRAILGSDVLPLTTKALLIHGCEAHASEDAGAVGWGKVPDPLSELIACRQAQRQGKERSDLQLLPSNEWRTEAEQRADLGKWETVLHATHTFRGTSLKGSVFDVHYNARDAGAPATGAERIPYALIIRVEAPRHADLHQEILDAHAVLQALVPAMDLPLRV